MFHNFLNFFVLEFFLYVNIKINFKKIKKILF
jgi:hypothetical protein